MPSLDTNILLRLILKDVPEQLEKAEALIATNDVLTIDDLAITETIFVLEKVIGLDRHDISKLIIALAENQFIEMNAEIISESVKLYLNFNDVSFNDCYLAIKAEQQNKIPLYTFDKALAKNLPKIAKIP